MAATVEDGAQTAQGSGPADLPPVSSPALAPTLQSFWLLFAIVVGIAAVAYVPLWLGQVLFYRDVGRWLHPARVFLHEALGAHESPLYNPSEGLGLGIAASPLYGVFYPATWFPTLGSHARALSLVAFVHLVWGAAGMLVLARRFGAGHAGSLIAALGWAFSGPITAVASAGQLLAAASWFPWCAVGSIALGRRLMLSRARLAQGIALASLAPAAAFLLGEIFQAALAALFGVVVALAWLVRGDAGRSLRTTSKRGAFAAIAALVASGALAAVVLVPLGAALGETERSGGLSRETAEKWSLHPLRLIEVVAPGAMGDPYAAYPGGPWAGDGAPDDRPLIYGVYVGASLLLCALAAFFRPRRRADDAGEGGAGAATPSYWTLGILGGLALLALLLALGRHTPVHAVFRQVVPIFAFQRAPEKYMLLFVPALALLAGLGADRIVGRAPIAGRVFLIVGGLVALGLVLLILAPFISDERVAEPMGAAAQHGFFATIGVLAIAALAARFGARVRLVPRLLALVAVVVIGTDLVLAALPLLVFGPKEMLDERPALASLALSDWGTHPGRPRVVRDPHVEETVSALVQGKGLVRLEALRYATLRPNSLTAHGLATLPGYDAGLAPTLELLWQNGQARALPLLRLLSVDYVLLPYPGAVPAEVPGLRLVGAPGPPGVALYAVTNPLPRVYAATSVEAATAQTNPQAFWTHLFSKEIVEGKTVLLEGALPSRPSADVMAAQCTLERFSNARIEASCDFGVGGHAVFVEQYGRGWRATVDDAPAPILRANVVMRAVPVPAGKHRVTMTYVMPGFAAGCVCSALAGIALLVALFMPRVRRSFAPSSA